MRSSPEFYGLVTGREKDLIILRGRNIYPLDVERAAEASSPLLRPGCSAVFVTDAGGGERLILCAELRKGKYGSAALGKIAETVPTPEVQVPVNVIDAASPHLR